MGLTDFRPMMRVEVDGDDISGILSPRLAGLTLTDAAGVQSDQVQIVLSDTELFGRIREPRQGAEIKVWLGHAFQLKYMGLFIADSFEVQGRPDQAVITGTASVNGETTTGKTALTEQKKRSWPQGTTVAAMVGKMAGEHRLKASVAESLREIVLPHIDQIDESDINLLSRVARDLDAIAKPGNGRLILAKRGESLTTSGQPMPVLPVTERGVSRWAYRNSLREKAGSVVAAYQDLGQGKQLECIVGEGSPIMRLKRRFPDKDTAQRAADTELRRLGRAGRALSIDMKGDPDAKAEAVLQAVGFRSFIDGPWLIARATHSLDSGGYRTAVEAEPLE
ncbi:contractile injection system protein, VgrG/Pvc8 family [Leisingera sp. ANG-Vp]|uniref:contractile injection system protein, VgrG/Pvc8 family n=1 Tax=Leisingera sp. ANG-Vp TaxID=1577896 RepID=UPI00058046C9|nr:contractile injection system protein, VgrG/Pvc8 family [Leisingera sp. ANG-Vp]KIC14071.1 late control protein D [Leisingera sp. ANG-Vp]